MAKVSKKLEDLVKAGEKFGDITLVEVKTNQVLIEYPENFNDGKKQGTILKRRYISKDEFMAKYVIADEPKKEDVKDEEPKAEPATKTKKEKKPKKSKAKKAGKK